MTTCHYYFVSYSAVTELPITINAYLTQNRYVFLKKHYELIIDIPNL